MLTQGSRPILNRSNYLSQLLTYQPAVPKFYIDFCRYIGVQLTHGQHIFCSIAFDGISITSLSSSDQIIARKLFGNIQIVPPLALRVITAVMGRRSGKSYLCAIRLLHLALTISLHTIAMGEQAYSIIVAPDKSQAIHTLSFVKGFLNGTLRKYKYRELEEKCIIKRPDGLTVVIECLAATRGGSAVRGRSVVGAMLEECAFFRDDKFVVNDTELFKALDPGLLVGGQILLPSTPYAEEGLLYDFYEKNFGNPIDSLAVHASTLEMQDNNDTRSYVGAAEARDAQAAAREFGANFLSSREHAFFDGNAIKRAIVDIPDVERTVGDVATAGADFGFEHDSSALVIVLRDSEMTRVVDIIERQPSPGHPLKPSEVVQDFAGYVNAFGSDYVMADGHYRRAIEEELEKFKLVLTPAPTGANSKSETYQVVRNLLREGKLQIPNHKRLIAQMKETTAKLTAGGGVKIDNPRWARGGHGDLVSALVLAVYDAFNRVPDAPKYIPSSLQEQREADAEDWKTRLRAEAEEDQTWKAQDDDNYIWNGLV